MNDASRMTDDVITDHGSRITDHPFIPLIGPFDYSSIPRDMNYLALLSSSVWTLLRNKMRSLLTVLGITIGIAAVICVVAIGRAGQARVEEQLNNLRDNFVRIQAGGRARNPVRAAPRG